MKKIILMSFVFLVSLGANAVPVYIGSYNVTDGADWESNPAVYSALEAAELIFGPAIGGTYSISITGTDINNISNSGYYSIIGIGFGVFDEDYSKDEGPTAGYNGGGWGAGDDISAYVNDPHAGFEDANNYVFFEATAQTVPEPSVLALFGIALLGARFVRSGMKQ